MRTKGPKVDRSGAGRNSQNPIAVPRVFLRLCAPRLFQPPRQTNMKIRLVVSGLFLATAAAPLVWAQEPMAPAPDQSQAAPAAPKKEKKTELEKSMDKIGKAYRKLKKQLADPAQNESSLALVASMEEGAKEALGLTPAKAEDVPEDQRAKFVDDFHSGIRKLQAGFAKLEEAIRSGKNDDAVAITKDLDALEKKDHKEFRRPERD